jgi:hypothetical protein
MNVRPMSKPIITDAVGKLIGLLFTFDGDDEVRGEVRFMDILLWERVEIVAVAF